jgi:hypothetical protein
MIHGAKHGAKIHSTMYGAKIHGAKAWCQDSWRHVPCHVNAVMPLYLDADDYGAKTRIHFLKSFRGNLSKKKG